MSIYIKGMEMPKSCGECRFAGVCGVHKAEEWPDLESIIFNDVIGIDGVRDPDCPLTHVQKHGRLIDADALFEEVYKVWGIEYDAGECNTLMGFINDAPTVIPAEDET